MKIIIRAEMVTDWGESTTIDAVYLKKFENMQDLLMGLTHYFVFYNEARRHQSLGYQTPEGYETDAPPVHAPAL